MAYIIISIVFRLDLEICLRVRADGANLGRLLTDDNMAAVAALPDLICVAREHQSALDVGQQLAVARLVLLFDLAHAVKQRGDGVEALFTRHARKALVHIRPLVVFAVRRVGQIHRSGGHAVVQEFEPQLGVFLLVARRLFKDVRDLDVAVLLCLGCVILVLDARLRFAGECSHQVGFGFAAFQIHSCNSFAK